MPYTGWFSLDGNEIGNEYRVRAYTKAMIPTLSMPADQCDTVDLAAVLGDAPYALPHIDDAPWFDPDNPDTARFCGFWPLGMSGLADSTREAAITEHITDGGNFTAIRRKTKEVRVSGLLIGQDEAAVEAGRSWLKAALSSEGCDPCDPVDLCYLAAVPNPDDIALGPQETADVPLRSLSAPSGRWNMATGVFTPTSTSQALSGLSAPTPLPDGEVFYDYDISAANGTTVTLSVQTEAGTVFTEAHVMDGDRGIITISDRGEGTKFSRVILTASAAVTVFSAQVRYNGPADPSACFDQYARQLHGVMVTSGPTVVEQFNPSRGAMERVEFSVVATVPWSYMTPVEVVTADAMMLHLRQPFAAAYPLPSTVAVCVPPRRVPLVVDPDAPVVPLAPMPNATAPNTGPSPEFTVTYGVAIPDDAVPLWQEAVPILALSTGDNAARAVRVRFFPNPLGSSDPADFDPCSVCGGFLIDYIPPHSTFTLDGTLETATITQPGNKVSPANHLLSGDDVGELFSWPVLTCGTGYLGVVDIASTTLVGLDLSIAVRE